MSGSRPAVDPALILDSPVARALTVIGDRWAFLVIRDAFLGVRRFEDFRRRSGAARGTLAARLKSLVSNGILSRSEYQKSPPRYEYRLNEMGLDMYPLVLAAWSWETRWSGESELPPALTHTLCGKPMTPLYRCGVCKAAIDLSQVRFSPGRPADSVERVPARFQRRSTPTRVRARGVDRRLFHFLDVVGDRWTGLVLAAQFFGYRRYDEIAAALGIATNILADRLKLLVSAGVLRRVRYQERPARYEYRLSDKGAALYVHTLQLHEWAERWLLEEGERPLLLEHRPCEAPLRSEVVCSECEKPLDPRQVTYQHRSDAAGEL